MGTPLVADAFFDVLEKSRLLSPAEIAAAIEEYDLYSLGSAGKIAEELVKHDVLTRFQASRLLEGRARGFRIATYAVQDVLGAGGMGWVYIAQDVNTEQQYALKMLTQRHETDAGMIARFKLEARAGLMMNHPNIVRTIKMERTTGVYGDVYYVVMDFVEGVSLEEMVALHGPIGWLQACDFMCQAAAGLQHAHEKGLVHRDVKPSNFLVDHDGRLQILDFGLSLIDKDEDEFSLAMIFGHDCLGTADYIAPEQTLDSFNVDARADVYSLGCTLYFMLSGRVPFPVKVTAEKLNSHRTKKPDSIRELVPNLPAEVATVVEQMMRRKPEQRYQSANEVLEALSPFAHRQSVEFDFGRILEARAQEAKQRVAALQKLAQRAVASSSLSSCAPDSAAGARQSLSNIETKIRKDTENIKQDNEPKS